jgi:hypothetical protein
MTRTRSEPSPSLRLSWRSVEEGARHCIYLQAAVARVAMGEMTREEALTWAALALSARVHDMTLARVEGMQHRRTK